MTSALVQRLGDLAARGDGGAIRGALSTYPPSGSAADSVRDLPLHLEIRVTRCQACSAGSLELKLQPGRGRKGLWTALKDIPLSSEAGRAIVG